MEKRMRMRVTLEVSADVNDSGDVRFCPSVDGAAVRAAIVTQVSRDALAAKVRELTRSRIDEGMVRVLAAGRDDGMRYAEHVRSTKLHHVLRFGATEEKWNRRGHQVGRGSNIWGSPSLHPDDLAALNAKAGA